MNIKLVATDMDGTLLDSKKRIPSDFMEWVTTHQNIKTVIASGRQYYNLEKLFAPIKDRLIFIADNGGLVFANGEAIYCNKMLKSDVHAILDALQDIPDIVVIICGVKSAYMLHATALSEGNAHMYYARLKFVKDLRECISQDDIVKLAIFFEKRNAEELYPTIQNRLNERISVQLSGDSWVDIANASVSKGSAIKAILEQYQIDKSQAMAFGDYLNDYTLLQACDESYAMENAHPEIKKISKYTAPSNDEDGVMRILRTI